MIEDAALAFSAFGLALYCVLRLGNRAPDSAAALAESLGPASRVERWCLLGATAVLFLVLLWRQIP